jgi:hypothetical protein
LRYRFRVPQLDPVSVEVSLIASADSMRSPGKQWEALRRAPSARWRRLPLGRFDPHLLTGRLERGGRHRFDDTDRFTPGTGPTVCNGTRPSATTTPQTLSPPKSEVRIPAELTGRRNVPA